MAKEWQGDCPGGPGGESPGHGFLNTSLKSSADKVSVIDYSDEAGVECCIQMRREQQPIEHVETLAVAFAIRPRLDMAGTKQLRNAQSGHRTSAIPVIDQACSK